MKSLTKSWKTSVGAVLAAVGLILLQQAPGEEANFVYRFLTSNNVDTLISAGGILLMGMAARDSNVRSESAGAK